MLYIRDTYGIDWQCLPLQFPSGHTGPREAAWGFPIPMETGDERKGWTQPMNLEALQLYCDIVRLHSFSRGADEHNISQSAASQTIQQMETDLRVRLLDRSKRPFSVTAEGQKFYETCRAILQSYEETRAEITQGQQELAGTVPSATCIAS